MIRLATIMDAAIMAEMRAAMWDEMNPDRRADDSFRERTAAYWREMLEAGGAVAWIAEVDQQPVGMAALLLHNHPPLPFNERRRGYVTGVYVAPAQRRQGLGRALMDAVMAYGREHGLQRLELRSSTMGRRLYAGLGFAPQEVLMLKFED